MLLMFVVKRCNKVQALRLREERRRRRRSKKEMEMPGTSVGSGLPFLLGSRRKAKKRNIKISRGSPAESGWEQGWGDGNVCCCVSSLHVARGEVQRGPTMMMGVVKGRK